MYANTGIATDSARTRRAARHARWLARIARRLFVAAPMPSLREPRTAGPVASTRLPITLIADRP
jgi:hypothetical protein